LTSLFIVNVVDDPLLARHASSRTSPSGGDEFAQDNAARWKASGKDRARAWYDHVASAVRRVNLHFCPGCS
jgi:hypothetical protein